MKPENLLLKAKHSCQDARCTMENLRCVDFGSAAVLENGELQSLSLCAVVVGSGISVLQMGITECALSASPSA